MGRRWEEGREILKKHLSSCEALIILDDVDDVDQLDHFLPIKHVLHPKNLILVTSRDTATQMGVLRQYLRQCFGKMSYLETKQNMCIVLNISFKQVSQIIVLKDSL